MLYNCCSGENDITFIISYDGKFENLEGGLCYIGGKVHYLQTAPHSLFGGIISAEIVDMYGQRVWYKFPYETCDTMGRYRGSVS